MNLEGGMVEDSERIEKSLAVTKIFIFQVEDTNQSFHHIGMNLSRNVLISKLIIFIITK